MRKLVINDRKRIGAWVAAQIGACRPWTNSGALGVEDEHGELVAGVVLDAYRAKGSGSLHCAGIGKRWLTREFLFAVFDYCFNQLELKALINTVAANNPDSIRFTEHIGFKEIHRVTQGWDGEADMIIYQLHRDDCRWLGERNAR